MHRIGRTGRANKKGKAISFLNEPERWHFKKCLAAINSNAQYLSIPHAVEQPATGREENISLERAKDWIKRQENPDYKGAFHRKKPKEKQKKKINNKRSTGSKW